MSADISTYLGMSLPWLSLAYLSPNCSNYAKCSLRYKMHSESARFSLNYAHEQTVHGVEEDLLFLGAAAPSSLRRRRDLGGFASPAPSQAAPPFSLCCPGGGWLSLGTQTDVTIAIATAGRRRRRLDAATIVELPWATFKPNTSS